MVHEQTQGQPWLVNAVAREIIVKILQSDYARPVTVELVRQAIRAIILRRDTHIDSLLERLKEERVRNVIEPMLCGEDYDDLFSDDYQYVTDLGLIKKIEGKIQPANPIYAEVITRTLSYISQEKLLIKQPQASIPRYLKDGKMDFDFLMQDFQQFWRENSDIFIDLYQYREAAPHLILQAFLQRIINVPYNNQSMCRFPKGNNAGGDILREPATGTGRVDICVVYKERKYPVELKIRRGKKTIAEGIDQTIRYMDTFGCDEGWLAIFDKRKEKTWNEKIFMKKVIVDGKTVTVVGL